MEQQSSDETQCDNSASPRVPQDAGNQHVFARGCTWVLAEVSPLPTNALCVAERGTALP